MMDPFVMAEFAAAVERYFPNDRPDAVLRDVKELRDLLRLIKRDHGSVVAFLQKMKNVNGHPGSA